MNRRNSAAHRGQRRSNFGSELQDHRGRPDRGGDHGAHPDRSEHDAHVTQLALQAGRGDREALNAFIAATHTDVWRLLAYLANTDQADDLTQETYLRVLKALPTFAARSSARTWLLAIARRTWVDSLKKKHRDAAASVAHGFDSDDHPDDSLAASRSAVDGVGSTAWAEWADTKMLLQQLDPERREALILTQLLGYSYAEAAHIANVRVGTIRSRVARARAELVEMAGPASGGTQTGGQASVS